MSVEGVYIGQQGGHESWHSATHVLGRQAREVATSGLCPVSSCQSNRSGRQTKNEFLADSQQNLCTLKIY